MSEKPSVPPPREKMPSAQDLVQEMIRAAEESGAHFAVVTTSDTPPVFRLMGKWMARGLWWLFRTKAGTAFAAGSGAAATWLSHHIWHWIR